MLEFLHRNVYFLLFVVLIVSVFIVWWVTIYNMDVPKPDLAVTAPEYNFDNIRSDADAIAFFKQFGFDVTAPPLECIEITLPQMMDAVYENYNRLQKRVGLDLTPYLGKAVTRVTYELVDHPFDTTDQVRGNLLVYQDHVIAGDIMTIASSGFMLALDGT